jgi:hypothetical protein
MAGDLAQNLRCAVSACVTSLCACIEAAQDVQAVETLLHEAKAMLLLDAPAEASSAHTAEPADSSLSAAVTAANGWSVDRDVSRAAAGNVEAQQRFAEQANSLRFCVKHLGQPGAVQAAFWGAPFAALAAFLLTGAPEPTLILHESNLGLLRICDIRMAARAILKGMALLSDM